MEELFQIDQVTHVEGLVVDSYVLSPENSFHKVVEDYGVSLVFPNTGVVDELTRLFKEDGEADHGRSRLQPWLISSDTISITSILKPRLAEKISEEFKPGTLLRVRFRPEIKTLGDAVVENLRLVVIQNNSDITDLEGESDTNHSWDF